MSSARRDQLGEQLKDILQNQDGDQSSSDPDDFDRLVRDRAVEALEQQSADVPANPETAGEFNNPEAEVIDEHIIGSALMSITNRDTETGDFATFSLNTAIGSLVFLALFALFYSAGAIGSVAYGVTSALFLTMGIGFAVTWYRLRDR